MSRQKLRIHSTPVDNLVANLRGEVGEIIFSWILMRDLMVQAIQLRTDDPKEDFGNRSLMTLDSLIGKLRGEIIARLSELAVEKIGRLNFYFAHQKLNKFAAEVSAYSRFIVSNEFRKKRNYDISHKELPEQWSDHRHISIPYRRIIMGIAMPLRLMKRIDREVLGPSAPYLWREMRKRRYTPMSPAKASYMLLPYLRLTEDERAEIIFREMTEGKPVWIDMETTIDGVEVTVKACRDWGAFLLGSQMIVLNEYPLQELSEISIKSPPTSIDRPPDDVSTNS